MSFRQKTMIKLAYFSGLSFRGTKPPGVWAVCVLFAVFLLLMVGCSRQHYRVKADKEVYSLLATGGTHDPRWKLDDYRINTDKRSRMFDPNHPDCEPMPPDDPTAHGKMHFVGGKDGSRHWHDKGDTSLTENPCWRQYLLFNEKGAVPLDKDGAVELALLHSPEYQSALESLYLSAMKVSRERFRFDVQFYGGDSLFYTANGRLRDGQSQLQNDAKIRAELLFATGGELVAGLANTVTWSFSGADTWHIDSLFNVGFVQPILRNAGKKIVLENLTQSERDFLTAIRQMVFFQQGYYTKIVTGFGQQAAPSGISSSTPSFGGGFYGLLAEQIRIQNQRQNILALEDNLQRFNEIYEAGQLSDISQVEETRQSLLTSESSLLQRISSYQGNIDTYVRSLGLPPDLKVDISDPLMEQFQLSSPAIADLQEDFGKQLAFVRAKEKPLPKDFGANLKKNIKRTQGEIKSLYQDLEVLQKRVPERVANLRNLEMNLAEQIKQGERIDQSVYDSERFKERVKKLQNEEVPENIQRLEAAFTLLELIIQKDETTLRKMIQEKSFEPEVLDALEILKLNESPDDTIAQRQQELEETQNTLEALKETVKTQESAQDQFVSPDAPNPFVPQFSPPQLEAKGSTSLSRLEAELAKAKIRREKAYKIVDELRLKDDYRDWIRRVMSAFQYELVSLSLMQTRARLDAITLVPISITAEDAFKIASQNRLDWMNRRASLVDTWRQIDLAANKLKSDLEVSVKGDMGTVDKHGVRFNGDNSSLQVGLAWDSPLTRHNEMLAYRETQIRYQAARRDYYSYVDAVNADIRRILRDSRLQQIDFEIARNAVRIATMRVDVTQLKMEEPPKRGGSIESNTALQLLNALNGLMNNQNEFLNTWVNYQTQRMLLDLNMGTMELDQQGRWIDPGIITKDRQGAASKYAATQTLSPKRRQPANIGSPLGSPRRLNDHGVPAAPVLEEEPVPNAIPIPMPNLAPPEGSKTRPKVKPEEPEDEEENEADIATDVETDIETESKIIAVAQVSQQRMIPKRESNQPEKSKKLKAAPLPPK